MSLSEIKDRYGNHLYFIGKEVFLRLHSGGRARKLGEVIGDTLHTIRNLNKHEMQNRHELGFNYHLMKYGRFCNVVVHIEDGEELKTTRKWILTFGRVCMPAGKRYELQIFLRISDFTGFVEPPEEPQPEIKRCEPVQFKLFEVLQ